MPSSSGIAEREHRAVRSRARAVLNIAALAAVYLALARAGLLLATVNQSTTAVWPPTGIALAALLLGGRALWPGVALGAFLANLTLSGAPVASLAIAAGNTLEALVGATLIRRAQRGRLLEGPLAVVQFAVFGGVVATAVGASIGTATLLLSGSAAPGAAGTVWLTWWVGDAVGAVLFGPLIVFWMTGRPITLTTARRVEWAAVYATDFAVALVVFGGRTVLNPNEPLGYLCLPIVLWAALRFGRRDAALTTLLMSAVAIWGTLHGLGPFVRPSQNESLLLAQTFTAVVALAGFIVASLVYVERRMQVDLEHRVAARTEELRRANAALLAENLQRQDMEAALRDSEQRLVEAQAVAHLGSWIWDVEPNSVWWSDELCRIYGAEPGTRPSYEDFIARVHPADRDFVDETVSRAVLDGQPFAYEHRIIRPDGLERLVAAHGQVVRSRDGRVIRMSGTGQDITERRRAEQELAELATARAAREQAEETNRLKDEFLAMVSHELRTPINVVLGWAHVLAGEPPGSDRARRAVEIIERNARAQARLIEDLLDVSALATGRIRLEWTRLEVDRLVVGAVESVAAAAEAKRIDVSVRAGDPAVVDGDGHRLQQVLTNLLGNAVKFTPDGGRVDVTTRATPEVVEIAVTDTGPGIDPAMLPAIFEPFAQGEGAGTHGGLGLGLAITRALVEAHGGSVRAESAGPGRGACFRVQLPRHKLTDDRAFVEPGDP